MSASDPKVTISEREVSKACAKVFKLYSWAIHIYRNNVGGFTDKYGHRVRFGIRGDCDFTGMFRDYGGRWSGRKLGVEIKRSDFDPTRISSKKERVHFTQQMTVMLNINISGGVAFWVRDSVELSQALPKILQGARVVFDEYGWPYLDI